MNRHLIALGLEAAWKRHSWFVVQFNVEYTRATVTIEMTMFAHIRAKPRRPALDGYLPRNPAFDQRVQAIINGRHRNIWHLPLGSDKYFLGGRVVALLQEHRINVLTLRGKTKTACRQAFVQAQIRLVFAGRVHGLSR